MLEDRFRKNHIQLNDMQQALMRDIKDQAGEMETLIDRVDKEFDVRCAYLAYGRLEEAVMWAVKGCTKKPTDA